MSLILDNASSISLDSYPNIRRSESINGYVRTEQSGPVFYRLSASMAVLEKSQFKQVQEEIMDTRYSITTLSTTIPHDLTYFDGAWGTGTVSVSSVSGRNVTLTGFTANTTGVAAATDYIQFSGSTKVYQIENTVNANASGQAIITLNTDPIQTLTSSSTITRGTSVTMKLQLMEIPPVQTVTGGRGIVYQFAGDFVFQEVL